MSGADVGAGTGFDRWPPPPVRAPDWTVQPTTITLTDDQKRRLMVITSAEVTVSFLLVGVLIPFTRALSFELAKASVLLLLFEYAIIRLRVPLPTRWITQRIELQRAGLVDRAKRPTRGGLICWKEVSDIRKVRTRFGTRVAVDLCVTPTPEEPFPAERRFLLTAPRTIERWWDDPDFDAKLAQIRAAWVAASAQGSAAQ